MERRYIIVLELIVSEDEAGNPDDPIEWDWATLLDLPDADNIHVLMVYDQGPVID